MTLEVAQSHYMATFNGETSIVELSVFAKKQQLDLSFFAKKQSLNQNKKLFSIKLHFSTYIYFVMYFLLSQINPVSVWLKLLAVYNKKVGFVNIYKNGFICFCKWTLHMQIEISFVICHSVKERYDRRHTYSKKVCDGVYSSLMSNGTLAVR